MGLFQFACEVFRLGFCSRIRTQHDYQEFQSADMFFMRSMTVSRQFLLLLSILFLVIGASALGLIFQFARFSAEGSRLIQNLQQTVALNQDLRRGINIQINNLNEQFDSPDPLFPKRFSESNYALGEKQTEYLSQLQPPSQHLNPRFWSWTTRGCCCDCNFPTFQKWACRESERAPEKRLFDTLKITMLTSCELDGPRYPRVGDQV